MLPKIGSAFVLIMRPVQPGLTARSIYLFICSAFGRYYFQMPCRGTGLTTGNLAQFVSLFQTLIQLQEFDQQMSYLFSCCTVCLRLVFCIVHVLFAPFGGFRLSQLPLKMDFLLIDHTAEY